MKRKSIRAVFSLALVGTVLAAFVALAADVGSQGDPLVTLSYLNDVFMGQVLEQVDTKLVGRNDSIRRELQESINQKERELLGLVGGSSAGSTGGVAMTYLEVPLEEGQTLYGSAGCEVILRSGSAVCVADGTPGLLDTTDGGSIAGGTALKPNHLYMMTVDRGVRAGESTVLLVRGEYAIE